MQRIEGTADVKLIECVNPVRGKWRIRWDVRVKEDGTADYMEAEFGHRPMMDEIRSIIVGWYNEQTQEAILSGFEYEGSMVWLSTENQLNYRAAYDLAVQTAGETLPTTFKLGTDDEPVYKTFDSVESLSEFYTRAMQHIQQTLEEGWRRKDAIDMNRYVIS